MLEFVDSDLYFVQDKNNSINQLLQVGSGSGSVEKSTGSVPHPCYFLSLSIPLQYPCLKRERIPEGHIFIITST